MEGTQRFYHLERGDSAPSMCRSWILNMKGLPPWRKATQGRCQPQQGSFLTSLGRYIEPRGSQRSDVKAWQQVHSRVVSTKLQEVSSSWLLSHRVADGGPGLSLPGGFTAVGKMHNQPQQLCLRMQQCRCSW